jgi:hypothetical protein
MNLTVRRPERVPAFLHLMVIVLLGALLTPAQLYAAAVGSVRGVVRDSQAHPVAGASVKIQAAASDWVQMTQTDAHGEFSFSTVAIGDYVLSITQSGFAATTQAVRVVSGSSPTARIQLAAGPVLEAVTVSAPAEASPASSATPTTLVNREDIERTPGAARSNSLAMITNFVPGAYVVHDQLHVRGGHQTTWAVDGVEIPNTNIASNLGPQIDPKDIDYLEVQRGSYEADQGDRTYGVFNAIPRTGFERNNQAEFIGTGGNFGQTDDYLRYCVLSTANTIRRHPSRRSPDRSSRTPRTATSPFSRSMESATKSASSASQFRFMAGRSTSINFAPRRTISLTIIPSGTRMCSSRSRSTAP